MTEAAVPSPCTCLRLARIMAVVTATRAAGYMEVCSAWEDSAVAF